LFTSEEEIIQAENRYTANVYSRRGVVAARGKGALLWDVNNKEYIDCMAGYGAAFIGHSNPRVISAIKTQAEKLQACHGSLYNDTRAQFLKKIVAVTPTGLDKVFLSNSGAESVELAIKLARKFTGRKGIIATMRSFHGKTMGALSATWNAKYRTPFQPLLPGVKFVPYGKAEKVKEAITSDTAAILVEPVQGEGGVYVAPDGYLETLRELADDKNLLLILDEVQTGFGRTGKLFACEHWHVTPGILCLAKAAASGVPIGITVAQEDVMGTLKVGEHTTTFGGNPISCAAASATLDVLVEGRLWERAAELGSHFISLLRRLGEEYNTVREVRGLGLMIGMDLRFEIRNIMESMLARGVIVLSTGLHTLRFLPPVAITQPQIEAVVNRLGECLADEGKRGKR
jgi:acetylornithine/LysW-gamma-L-lysine aminotransferase